MTKMTIKGTQNNNSKQWHAIGGNILGVPTLLNISIYGRIGRRRGCNEF